MIEAILYAIPLGITLAFAAGPIFFVVIETSISKSKTSALMIDLGALSADILFIIAAYYGSQSFLIYLESHPWISLLSGVAVAIFGMVYLFKSRQEKQFQKEIVLPRKRHFFVKGFALNFLNIGVFLYWIATTIAVGSRLNYDPNNMLVFYITTLCAVMVIEVIKIYFANKFKERIKGAVLQKIEKAIGLILIGFGLFIAVRAYWV